MSQLSTTNKNPFLVPRPKADGAAKPLSIMDRLFNKLDGHYPHKWRSAFSSEAAIQNWRDSWSEGFIEEGLNPHEIKRGIVACRKLYDWPPSLKEFISACRPPVDFEAAYFEAVVQLRRREMGQDVWSNKAIYWAAVRIGQFDLTAMPYDRIKSRWSNELTFSLAALDLPDVPPRLQALPAPGKTTTTQEVGRERMSEIMERFFSSKDMHKCINEVENE